MVTFCYISKNSLFISLLFYISTSLFHISHTGKYKLHLMYLFKILIILHLNKNIFMFTMRFTQIILNHFFNTTHSTFMIEPLFSCFITYFYLNVQSHLATFKLLKMHGNRLATTIINILFH